MALPRRTRTALTTTATTAAALPASLALVVAAGGVLSTTAQAAAPGPELRILSPRKSDQPASKTFTIDVSFRGRTATQGVTAAEVWVDGVRWTRRELAGQRRGVLTLDLDGSTLPAGRHEVVVKLFGSDGTTSSKTTVIEAGGGNTGVAAGNALGGAEIAFHAPAGNARVSGVVDVTLDVADKSGAGNPYVTFYVDKEFKTLKNYPPYSFSWDTTNVANGSHTIEATAFSDNNTAPVTRRVQVLVDNAGGNTPRLPEIPDLRAPRAPATAVPATAASTAVPLVIPTTAKSPARTPRGVTGVSRLAPAPPRFAAPVASPAHALVTPAAASLVADPRTPAVFSQGPDLRMRIRPEARGIRLESAFVAPPPVGGEARLVVPSGAGRAVAPIPGALMPGLRAAGLDWTAGTVARPEPLPPVPARPSATTSSSAYHPTRRAVVAAAPLLASVPERTTATPLVLPTPKPAAATRPAAKKPVHRQPHVATRRRPAAGTIQVAFNGQQIAFDVAPRVEAGLPLAPFRQIFEHTGGRVTWVAETRVVRAVSSEREIVITVGKNTARVNDQTISLARPAFVEQGRAIVPLAFIGKALDVNVQYDPATGRLQITSKNK